MALFLAANTGDWLKRKGFKKHLPREVLNKRKVPKRIIDKISRMLERELAAYAAALAPAHQPLFTSLVMAVLKASSCYVSDAARELEGELGDSIMTREDKLLNFIHSPKLRRGALKQTHLRGFKRLVRSDQIPLLSSAQLTKPP